MDRLGSVRGNKYLPFGEEQPATANDTDKFATYFRDSTTGLDYAMNRYYGSSLGRFLTPDPYGGSSTLARPSSWNRYVYVESDPVNYYDPLGLFVQATGQVFTGGGSWNPYTAEYRGTGGAWDYWLGALIASANPAPPAPPPATERSRKRVLTLIDEDCATALGADSVGQARDKLQGIKITYNNLGNLQFVRDQNNNLVAAQGSKVAAYNPNLGSRGINLNTNVNWVDPNNTTALNPEGNQFQYRLLDAKAYSLGISSMTAEQFMDITIAHELSHSFGTKHQNDPDSITNLDKNIWEKCFK
jgi:RHS repeat-associated protein